MPIFRFYPNWLEQIPTPKELGENMLASFPFILVVLFVFGILLIIVTFLALKLNLNWLAIAPIPEEELRDEFWRRNQENIEARLQQSLKGSFAIATPQEFENVQTRERTHLETNQPILEIFEESDRRLLIVGESGSGKTTELLKLARSLGEKYKENSQNPIPFILDLSSWQGESLWNWIIWEIERQSGLERKWGQKWLECGQIIPLLDSLEDIEEAKRERVIIEIEALRECDREQFKAFALCCQTEDYQRIKADEKRTWGEIDRALHLCEVSDRQIESYLQQCQAIDLWQNLSSQPGFMALARIPILFNLMVATYPNGLPENASQDLTECENRLFNDWLSRKFSTPQDANYRDPQKARNYLVWLASKMETEGMKQREFAIDGLQPAWLDNQRQWQQYRWLCGLAIGSIWGLTWGLMLDWKLGLIWGFIFTLSESRRISVESIEFKTALSFSWRRMRRGLLRGLLWGSCLGLFFILFAVTIAIVAPQKEETLTKLIYWLVYFFFGGMLYGFWLGISSGLQNDLKVREYPNQGAWEIVKKGAIASAWFVPFFVFGNIFVPSTETIGDISLVENLREHGGFLILIIFSFSNGEILVRHFTLRWVLLGQGRIPWNYSKFLNDASEVGILTRSGGRYRFNGDRLQKHLAREISLSSYSIPKYQFTWRAFWVTNALIALMMLVFWVYISLDDSFISIWGDR